MSVLSPITLDQIRARVRKFTHTNATNYTDADIDRDANLSNGEIWMTILEAEGYKNTGGDFKVQDLISTIGLVAQDLGFNGEYPFPSLALLIDRAEISYDGLNWREAEIIDKSDTLSSVFQEDSYNIAYSQTNPKIFIFRDSYFVRPTKNTAGNITDGIKLCILARQEGLSNDSDSPQFETNFHELIPLKVAQDYSLVFPEKRNPYIDKKILELEGQLISFYQERTPMNIRLKSDIRERGLNNW